MLKKIGSGMLKLKGVAGLILVLNLLALMACDRFSSLDAMFGKSNFYGSEPKQRLSQYISKSFSISEVGQKSQLLELMTGEVKSRLESWSDDQFREAFIDSGRQFVKLSFTEVKSISPNEVEIIYDLVFMDAGSRSKGLAQKKKNETKVTTRKLCRMVLEQGKWLIAEVRNIKELLEFQNELSLP